MQENVTIFDNVPYEARAVKSDALTPSQAQEAITDVLLDTSAYFKMPSRSSIIRVRSESAYGVYKVEVTVAHGTNFPEYMLSGRVAELEPKLVSVVFQAEGF